jgi:hypothetical protein
MSTTMAITAADVNKLRQMTGAGMMDCKKALTEANGDFDAAIDLLRKKGQKVAAKRADRDAMEGLVLATSADGTQGRAGERELRDRLRGQERRLRIAWPRPSSASPWRHGPGCRGPEVPALRQQRPHHRRKTHRADRRDRRKDRRERLPDHRGGIRPCLQPPGQQAWPA